MYPALASKCVVKLSALLEWLRHQREFRFYSTSLVLFLDGSDPLNTCDCRWDSFSNIVRCHQETERRSSPSEEARSKDFSRAAGEKSQVVSSSSSFLVQGVDGATRSDVDMKGCNEEEEKKERESEEEEEEDEGRTKDKVEEKKNTSGIGRDPHGMQSEGSLPEREGGGESRDPAKNKGRESDAEEDCEKKKKTKEEDRKETNIESREQIDQDVNEGIRHGLTIILNIARDCLWGRKERKKAKKTLNDGEG